MSRIWVGSIGRKLRNSEAAPALNMFPKFDEVPISTYLIVLAKMRRPSTTPSARMSEVLVEQDDVGRVLGDVGRGLDRDADVGVVQRDRVVDPVAEEADRRRRGARCALMTRDFCSGVTRAKIVVCGSAAASASSSSSLELASR